MTYLLDTHVFIWMVTDDARLSGRARDLLADPANRRLLSSISGLELAIKLRLGKLNLHVPLVRFIEDGMANGLIDELPVRLTHTARVADLPLHHRDPFDRLLVAQSQVEGISLLTDDHQIARYDVNVVWAS